MATIFNDRRVLGVRLVDDGTVMHNGLPVIGVKEAGDDVLFSGNLRTLGVDVLDDDAATIYNDQPVRGAVLIEDDRALYNHQPVIQVKGEFAAVLTAGEVLTDGYGYSDGTTIPQAGGSFSGSIVDGHHVRLLLSTPTQVVLYLDGHANNLFGKSLWIDGTEFPPDHATFHWGQGSNYGPFTAYRAKPNGFAFAEGEKYRVKVDDATFPVILADTLSGGGVGYSKSEEVGSQFGELVAGHDLLQFQYAEVSGTKTYSFSFAGDLSHLAGTHTIYIYGNEIAPDPENDWKYYQEYDATFYVYSDSSVPVTIEAGKPYVIEVIAKPYFDPAALFSNGEDGAFLDPSNLDTLFQDEFVTPAADPGDVVGWCLDAKDWGGKSFAQMAQDQPEILLNGDFSEGLDNWDNLASGSGTVTLDGGTVELVGTDSANRGRVRQTFETVAGAVYLLTIDVAEVVSGGATIGSGPGTSSSATLAAKIAEEGINQMLFVASSTLSNAMAFTNAGGGNIKIRSFSVKEIPGNHAVQATLASRPILQQGDGNWYLQDDGVNDSLNVSLPADDYTRVYVDADGVVTIDEEVAISGAENILQVPQLAGILYINRELTNDEKVGLIAWWQA